MKAYKFEVIVLDFEGYGSGEYKTLIEQHRHLNGNVIDVKEADIGPWTDDHMLNKRSTTPEQIRELFK